MSDKQRLREQRAGTVINATSKKQETEVMQALAAKLGHYPSQTRSEIFKLGHYQKARTSAASEAII